MIDPGVLVGLVCVVLILFCGNRWAPRIGKRAKQMHAGDEAERVQRRRLKALKRVNDLLKGQSALKSWDKRTIVRYAHARRDADWLIKRLVQYGVITPLLPQKGSKVTLYLRGPQWKSCLDDSVVDLKMEHGRALRNLDSVEAA